jgi:hypothetical protein
MFGPLITALTSYSEVFPCCPYSITLCKALTASRSRSEPDADYRDDGIPFLVKMVPAKCCFRLTPRSSHGVVIVHRNGVSSPVYRQCSNWSEHSTAFRRATTRLHVLSWPPRSPCCAPPPSINLASAEKPTRACAHNDIVPDMSCWVNTQLHVLVRLPRV